MESIGKIIKSKIECELCNAFDVKSSKVIIY